MKATHVPDTSMLVSMMRPAIFLISAIIGLSAFSQEDKIGAIQVEVQSDASTGEEVFIQVENMPVFPGCELEESENAKKACTANKMMEHILQNLDYPESARNKRIAGTVFVKFVVNKEGYVSEVELLRGVDKELDRAAQAVLFTFPKMTPAMQQGRKVNVSYNLPVRFYLDDNEREEKLRKAPIKQLSAEELALAKEQMPIPYWAECLGASPEEAQKCMADAFVYYVQGQVKYPKKALYRGISGVVEVTFDVDSRGKTSNIHVSKPVHLQLDLEALRVVRKMPKFEVPPNLAMSEPIRYAIPIYFEFQ